MGLCENCANFRNHKEKCWFYWENKSQCSLFRQSFEHEPEFREE